VIRERLGSLVYSEDESEMEEVVGRLLKEKGFTVSTAESSTGGMIASRIVNVPGASQYMMGSIVSYSNHGGTPEKPVGLHYVGYSDDKKTEVHRVVFKGDRNDVRLSVSQFALNLIRLNLR